jgi:hypothetical protein
MGNRNLSIHSLVDAQARFYTIKYKESSISHPQKVEHQPNLKKFRFHHFIYFFFLGRYQKLSKNTQDF